MLNDESASRHAIHHVLLSILLVTAGCSGISFDSSNGSEPMPSTTSTSGANSANATDLRSITVPTNGSTTASGQVDNSDPVVVEAGYEPVQFAAEAGMVVNITMQTNGGKPKLRLYNPNGTIVDTTGTSGSKIAQLTSVGLTDSGYYTIEAAASEPENSFEYNLTIERDDRLFSEPMSMWNETEQYLEFGQDFTHVANATANNGKFLQSVGQEGIRASASGDYIIITYQWDAENLTGVEMNEIDTAIFLSYTNLCETYEVDLAQDSNYVEDVSWVPEVIYFRTENPQGEVFRTTFLTREWARDYGETNNSDVYANRYYSTNRIGPGSPSYEPGGKIMTTESEFPLETYRNYTYPDGTTHAERYYD